VGSYWQRQEKIAEERKGLTQRGLFGCVSFIISVGIAIGIYYWVTDRYSLYRVFTIPRDWPEWLVTVIAVAILTVAFQATITIISSVFWRLAGKDKKVKDQMDALLEQWDDMDSFRGH